MQLRPLNPGDQLISAADLDQGRRADPVPRGWQARSGDSSLPGTNSVGNGPIEAESSPRSGRRRRGRLAGLMVFGVLLLAAVAYVPNASERGARLAQSAITQPVAAAIPVTSAPATRRDVSIYRTGLGSVQAYNTVAVTSRVDGQLEAITFEEGQEIKAGDVLARVDARIYQAAVRQKEAQLRAATAVAKSARADLDRMQTLLQRDVGSRQTYEAQAALVEQNEAQVEAAGADLDNARLQLEYATIRSPIDGRVGFRQVDIGNMVRSIERTPIVTVTQMQPINIVFTLPQEDLLAVGRRLADGQSLSVSALARDGRLDLGNGRLSTIDNQVDANTGTFKLKARFENERKLLWPGEFVTVRLMVDDTPAALVIPAPAVQRSQQGAYAYVIGADDVVEMRPVEVGLIQDGIAVIKSGIAEGETVVVDGQFKLEPGSRVSATPALPGATASDAPVTPPG